MADKLTLTAANAVILLGVNGVFSTPQQLKGFAADDVTDIPPIESAETAMGVDGVLSAGFVFVPVKQGVTLQADSASNDLFDLWWETMQQQQDVFFASGSIVFPATKKSYTLTNGVLTEYKPAPDAKRTLQPRKYEITWESISPSIIV